MAHFGLAIDLQACIGCHTCSVACRTANNLPKDMWWCRIHTVGGESMDTSSGTYPNAELSYLPVNCMHCDNPACVAACPTGASYKKDNGIVAIDSEKCIGCLACIGACPYAGVRTHNANEPEYDVEFALGAADAPKHVYNTVEKCNLCMNRTERGEVPYCVEACPAHARVFGDLDDLDSEIAKLLCERETTRLLEEKGTEPSVYYLV